MGALHQGHMTLIERALKENNTVLVTIFINPTQFNDKTDLERYPQDLDADIKKNRTIQGEYFCLHPSSGRCVWE
jgi:pantoate--beta-alanine ligase